MKLKWSEMKEPALKTFTLFKRSRRSNFMAWVNPIYTHRCRAMNPPRVPEPGPATQAFETSKANWDADARELRQPSYPNPLLTKVKKIAILLEHPDPRDADVYLRVPVFSADRFNRTFMFQTDDGTKYNTVLPTTDTKIDAVGVRVAKGPARSRLNLVVRPECTGKPLFHKLLAVSLILTHKSSSSSGAIIDWKVMSPELGAKGPESAVIYLSEPLADAKVQHVITVLSALLHSDLVALPRCPLGMIKYTDGIYGCDLPDENSEKEVFNNNTSGSSIGRLISMIICKAAWEAAHDLHYSARKERFRQERSAMASSGGTDKRLTWNDDSEKVEEAYVKFCLKSVLGELEWELED